MAHIAYLRVSTSDQSVESQRHALLKGTPAGRFDKEFKDEAVSGAVPAAQRPGFAALLSFVQEGNTLVFGHAAGDIDDAVRPALPAGP